MPEEDLRSLLLGMGRQWSGLLPDPESFNKYPLEAREHMIAWNDAQILDESGRGDRLVDAEIRQKAAAQVMTFALNALFAVLSFAAFVMTGDAAAFALLAVPGVTIAVNVAVGRKRDRARDDGPANS